MSSIMLSEPAPLPSPAAPVVHPRDLAHRGVSTISVGIIGPGKVGQALLRQLRQASVRLRRESGIGLEIAAIIDRSRLWLDPDWIDADGDALPSSEARPGDWQAFGARLDRGGCGVVVDCSASEDVADRYAQWLAAGLHVVTPNKQAGAGPLPRYGAIRAAAAMAGSHFRAEATVGAGLPVIQTLRDLLDTGDELIAIDGILSGTLAWLFNRYDGRLPFSELVREARSLGYTEPDPRDDLAGTDVARKLVILGREAGLRLSLGEVDVESLVPPALAALEREQFLEQLPALDAPMRARFEQATGRGEVLRYVARLAPGDASAIARVALVALPAEHAFAHLRLTDNVVQFTTRRYANNPLVVQGPGAGPEVTAAGVFADLLRVASSMGARV